MTRPTDGFEKLERTEKPLYGPRKLLLCGFPVAAQIKFKGLLDRLALNSLPLVWAGFEHSNALLIELLMQADGSGDGGASDLPRAIIASGITQQELHTLMGGYRQSGMQASLWAVLTPTSERWPLSRLLAALAAEAEAMKRKNSPR